MRRVIIIVVRSGSRSNSESSISSRSSSSRRQLARYVVSTYDEDGKQKAVGIRALLTMS